MFPSYTSQNGSTTSSGTSHSVSLPAGVASGDLLLGFFACTASSGTPTPTWPVGWTKFTHATGTTFILSVAYKFAGGSETTPFTISTAVSANAVFRTFDVVDAHASTVPVIGTEVVSLGTTPNPPAVNPSAWDVEDTLWIAVVTIANASGVASAAPSGFTNLISATGGSNGLATAHLNSAVASVDPGTFTSSPSTSYRTNTIAVRPSLASGGGAFPRQGDQFHV